MNEEATALVRRVYETWNERGPDAISPMLADGVELHDAPELPDAQVWRGRDAVVSRLKAVADTMGGGSVEFQGFRPSGDDVLVAMCWQLDPERKDVALAQVFHLVRVDGAMISRIRVFLTEADALA